MSLALYYSGPEHQKADWLGIHERICQLLMALRSPIPFLGSEEERQKRKHKQTFRKVNEISILHKNGDNVIQCLIIAFPFILLATNDRSLPYRRTEVTF